MIGYNKLCNVGDFDDLAADIKDVFRHIEKPKKYRKFWEQVQQIRGLRDHGALKPDSWILGVGAGVEVTNYYLTHHVDMVVATDIYSTPGWDDYAPSDAPENPGKYAPYLYRKERLAMMDMDARKLLVEDNTYDGIYSASSIEHFGTPDQIAQAMKEMARVLAPGGILALSTEFDINGKTGPYNANTFIFNEDTLWLYVIEPSGCIPVDAFNLYCAEGTRRTSVDLEEVIKLAQKDAVPEPHIVIRADGYEFAPISLVMRKPDA